MHVHISRHAKSDIKLIRIILRAVEVISKVAREGARLQKML